MTSIFYTNPELVIGQNRKVIFVNPNDLQIFKEIELPDDLTTCGLKVTEPNAADVNDNDGEAKAPNQANAIPSIQHVVYSSNHELLAITTTGQKALLLYKCRPEHAKLLSVRALSRVASALVFANDATSVLVTDKTGDCYQYDCVKTDEPPRLLLGHLSIVYDIAWTPDQSHIITCDRDDKIRVTNYPSTYDIKSYCLGHTEFVSGVALLDNDSTIVSVSGDKTLRIWNYLEGEELQRHQLPAPAVHMELHYLESSKKYQVAVLFHNHTDAIGLYDLKFDDTKSEWTVTLTGMIESDASNWHIHSFTRIDRQVYVTGAVDERLELRVFNICDNEPAKVPDGWLEMVLSQFPDHEWMPEDRSVWFKKHYDNVSIYMSRKKRRIEEKQQQQQLQEQQEQNS